MRLNHGIQSQLHLRCGCCKWEYGSGICPQTPSRSWSLMEPGNTRLLYLSKLHCYWLSSQCKSMLTNQITNINGIILLMSIHILDKPYNHVGYHSDAKVIWNIY